MEQAQASEGEYSRQASLALVGQRFRELGVWEVVSEHVQIRQKVFRHTPADKLLDHFVNMLAGGVGVAEVNLRVRPDGVVQRAFGRARCADQATVSATLSACTAADVEALRLAGEEVLRRHGRCTRHDFATGLLLLDMDMMGQPTAMDGEGVTKGYFSGGRNQRGRQLGRVLAEAYDEVVADRLYEGRRQLERGVPELLTLAERALPALGRDEKARQNTAIRLDAGGGTDANFDLLLGRRYHVLGKVHNWQRAIKLALSVTGWQADPKVPGREVGWVTQPHPYARPTHQLAVRVPGARGRWHYAVVVSSLAPQQARDAFRLREPLEAPWLLLHAYDLRGGGLETANRCDKQGLGLSRRGKHAFAAQEMLILLTQLAHNFVTQMRNELAGADAHFRGYGPRRMVRDVFQIDGHVRFAARGAAAPSVAQVRLNPDHPFSPAVLAAWGPHGDDL